MKPLHLWTMRSLALALCPSGPIGAITAFRQRCEETAQRQVNELLAEDSERSERTPIKEREISWVDAAVRRLAARVVDQISGNYNYKMGVAWVKKIGESQYKKEFRSFSWAPRNIV